MKKRARVFCLVIAVLLVFTMLPVQSYAATSNSKLFANLKASDVMKKYNKPLPKGGTIQSESQIRSTLASIGYKIPGKGSVYTNFELSFSTVNGTLNAAEKYAKWEKTSKKNYYLYSEYTVLYGAWENLVSPTTTHCQLIRDQGGLYSHFYWDKNATIGESYCDKVKMSMIPSSSMASAITRFDSPKAPAVTSFNSPLVPAMTSFKKYKDAEVLGQKCFVYSYKYKGSTSIMYNYVSRKTGQTLKTVSYHSKRYVETTIYFIEKYMSKAPNNFAIPTNVTFIEY